MYSRGLVFGAAPIVSPLGSAAPATGMQDVSRFKNNGAFVAHTSWTQLPTGLWVGALDGTDDYISVPAALSLNLVNAFTATIWVSRNEVGVEGRFFGRIDYPASKWRGWMIMYTATNILYFYTGDGSVYGDLANTTYPVTDNAPRMITCSFDGYLASNHKKVFVNGELKYQGDATLNPIGIPTAPGTLQVGAGATYGWIKGYAALPRLYNYALSADQISRIYEAEKRWFV